MSINKSKLIQRISQNCDNMDDYVVEAAVKRLFELMAQTLQHDGRIEIRGFGSFCLHHHDQRQARNPKTGEQVMVKSRAIPHFKPGKALRLGVIEEGLMKAGM